MNAKAKFIAFAMAVPFALAAHNASATNYSFTSTGAFSNLNNAISVGSSEIKWGSPPSSTLTGSGTSQSGLVSSQPVLLGTLTWYNSSDAAIGTVSADYKLSLDFTAPPPGGTGNTTIDLVIQNTPNSCNGFYNCFFGVYTQSSDDTLTPFDPSTSVAIDGLILSNFSFSLGDSNHGTACNDPNFTSCAGPSFVNGVWYNPENATSTLSIYANISPVPEPASLLLLGSGLTALGMAVRRRRSSVA